MKKAQTLTAFILLAINIWMRFYAPINRVALILKHVSLFLIVGIGAYAVTTAIFKKLIIKYNPAGRKETTVYVSRVFSFGLIIILFGSFQLNYVEFSETPMVEGCQYYDKYSNMIYQSKYYTSCPELDIITNNETVLEFNVQEYSIHKDISIPIDSDPILDSQRNTYEDTIYSTIKIEYNENSNISKILN